MVVHRLCEEAHAPGIPVGGFSVSGVGNGTVFVDSSSLRGWPLTSFLSDWLDIMIVKYEVGTVPARCPVCISAYLRTCLSRYDNYKDV